MSRRTFLLATCIVVIGSGASGAADELIRRAYIPSDRNVHGELRLIRRDGATCVAVAFLFAGSALMLRR